MRPDPTKGDASATRHCKGINFKTQNSKFEDETL